MPNYALLPIPRPSKASIGTIEEKNCTNVSDTCSDCSPSSGLPSGDYGHQGSSLTPRTDAMQGTIGVADESPKTSAILCNRAQRQAKIGRSPQFLGAEGVSPGIGLGRRSWDWAVVGGSWCSEGSGRVQGMGGMGMGSGWRPVARVVPWKQREGVSRLAS